jgi:hypothetical protein
MIVLRNYDATDGNARIIKVRNVAKTTVFDVYSNDITSQLHADGILRDNQTTPQGSMTFAIAQDIADCVNSLEIFDVQCVIESFPDFDGTKESERLGVSYVETEYKRESRTGYSIQHTFRIVRYKNVSSTSPEALSACLDPMERLADSVANLQIMINNRTYNVVEMVGDFFDVESFAQNLIYAGALELKLATARTA